MSDKLVTGPLGTAVTEAGARAAIFGDGGGGDERRNFADFLLSVRTLDNRRLEDVYRSSKAALTTQGGAQGGYLVPEEFLPRLLGVAAERAIARPRATVIPMGAGTLHIPALDLAHICQKFHFHRKRPC